MDWVNATTLSGTFAAGDAITLSSLTEADWTPAFCEQWITDITSGNGVSLTTGQVTTICVSLLASPQLLLKQASNPNISYVSKNGSVRIGTATLFNASPVLKGIAAAAGIPPNAVPDVVQFSEPVKVTYEGETSILYCADNGSIAQSNQWANDLSCNFNDKPDLAKQFCSHSGNCEIVIDIAAPPPPAPVPAVSALGLAGGAAGLLAIGLAGLRRRRHG